MASFVLLDTETTGAMPEDRLCQIAFLVAEAGKNLRFVESFCKPPLAIKVDAMAVHHITNEMVADKPPFDKSLAKSELDVLNSAENYLVIHNAPFDMAMIEKEGIKWQGKTIDTLKCAKHLIESDSHALQYLRYSLLLYKEESNIADQLGVAINAHDAVGDVVVLYLLMQHLLAIVGKNSAGIEELIRLTNTPVLIKKFKFGKHKGKLIEEVAKTDSGYLDWLYKEQLKSDQKDEDMIFTLEHYRRG